MQKPWNCRKKLDEKKKSRIQPTDDQDKKSENTAIANLEAFKEALSEVHLCSRVEELLIQKKSITPGDSLEIHSQKVDKLKVLADSLASSSSKAEQRIVEHRHQKEDALNFCVKKRK
jgi:hypothetical protein